MLAICMDGECYRQTKIIDSDHSFKMMHGEKEIVYIIQEIYYLKTVDDNQCIALAFKKKY